MADQIAESICNWGLFSGIYSHLHFQIPEVAVPSFFRLKYT